MAELVDSNGYLDVVTIQLFDKSGFDGGVAYRVGSDHHLLNMKTSKMPIRVDDDQDFLRRMNPSKKTLPFMNFCNSG